MDLKPKIEQLSDEFDLWHTWRKVHLSKGLDIAALYAELADQVRDELNSPGAREEFSELCHEGCLPQGLAAVVLLLRHSPFLENLWIETVGHARNRDKATHALEDAARTVEGLFGAAIAKGPQAETQLFEKMGRIPVSRVVSELRFYNRVINLSRFFREDTETRSLSELSKYFLTSYVRRMTGRFHDRCVSGLVGEIAGPSDYNEVAQRMWRARNYERLDKHQSWLPKFLVAMSVVVEHTT